MLSEKKTIYKWFFVYDFAKEEKWLNEMAHEGWTLVNTGWCRYDFEKTEPDEYIIRVEYTARKESDYVSFVQDTGADVVKTQFGWTYFRKKSCDGDFRLLGDLSSKIEHLKNIALMLKAVGFANICLGIANSLSYSSIGWINLLCGCLIMYCLGRIEGKKESLEEESMLME